MISLFKGLGRFHDDYDEFNRNKKVTAHYKDPKIIEIEQLLAIAEIRYIEDVRKLQGAISRNIRISNFQIINMLLILRKFIKSFKRLTTKMLFYKWRTNMKRKVRK